MESSKYWICRIDEEHLSNIDEQKILCTANEGSEAIKSVNAEDKILFFTPISNEKSISFIGYGPVEYTFNDPEYLLESLQSEKKVKLKGIKYFTEPVLVKDIAGNLKFIKNKENLSSYFKSEFREIAEEDFNYVTKRMNSSKAFPGYFDKMFFTRDEFLNNSIKGTYELVKNTGESNQIEIKEFIKLLHKLVSSYGISKSYEDIEEYYSQNVWKLGFEHSPSRNSDILVKLYGPRGNSNRFGYLKLI
jgi:predicted RNA-binding protein